MPETTLQLDDEPAIDDVELTDVLAALSEPGRLAAVRALATAGEASCKDINQLAGTDWSKSTVSHHLRVLREAGVTHTRISGTRRFISLREQELDAAFPGLLTAVLHRSA